MNSTKSNVKNIKSSSSSSSSSNTVIYLVVLLLLLIVVGVLLYFFVFRKKEKKYKCDERTGVCIESDDGKFTDDTCDNTCAKKYYCNGSNCNVVTNSEQTGTLYNNNTCDSKCGTTPSSDSYYCSDGTTKMCLKLTDANYAGNKYNDDKCSNECKVKYYCDSTNCKRVTNPSQTGDMYDTNTCDNKCSSTPPTPDANEKCNCVKTTTAFTCEKDNTSDMKCSECRTSCVLPTSCNTASVNLPKILNTDGTKCICPDGFTGEKCDDSVTFGSGNNLYWTIKTVLDNLMIEPSTI
jgi:hypothetical protein